MRYQGVAYDDEIGANFQIEEIAWMVHPPADPSAKFSAFNIYMRL